MAALVFFLYHPLALLAFDLPGVLPGLVLVFAAAAIVFGIERGIRFLWRWISKTKDSQPPGSATQQAPKESP